MSVMGSAIVADGRRYCLFSNRDRQRQWLMTSLVAAPFALGALLDLWMYFTGQRHGSGTLPLELLMVAGPLSFFAFGSGLLAYERGTVYLVDERQISKVRPGGATTKVSFAEVTLIEVERQEAKRVVSIHAPGGQTPYMGFGIRRDPDNEGLMRLLWALRQTEVGERFDPLVLEMLDVWREANDATPGDGIGRHSERALEDLKAANFVGARRRFRTARKRGEVLPPIADRVDDLAERLDL